MKQITIRRATQKDLSTLLQFEQGIISTEGPFDITLKPDPISYYDLRHMISLDDVEIAVAEIDGKLIGSGYAKLESAKEYYKHKRYAYLGFMFIDPNFRGQGINKRILEFLYSWIKKNNVSEVRLEVYSENKPAIRAYEKAGFKPIITEMRKFI